MPPDPSPNATPPYAINISQDEAAKRTGLSAKTLERLSKAGERIGRFRVGNRVLFHLDTLNDWFRARASARQQKHI